MTSFPKRDYNLLQVTMANTPITTTTATGKHRMIESSDLDNRITKRPKLNNDSNEVEDHASCPSSTQSTSAPNLPKSDAQKWQQILNLLNSIKAIRDRISDKLDTMVEDLHNSDGLVLGMDDELDRMKRQLQRQSSGVGDETQRSERRLE